MILILTRYCNCTHPQDVTKLTKNTRYPCNTRYYTETFSMKMQLVRQRYGRNNLSLKKHRPNLTRGFDKNLLCLEHALTKSYLDIGLVSSVSIITSKQGSSAVVQFKPELRYRNRRTVGFRRTNNIWKLQDCQHRPIRVGLHMFRSQGELRHWPPHIQGPRNHRTFSVSISHIVTGTDDRCLLFYQDKVETAFGEETTWHLHYGTVEGEGTGFGEDGKRGECLRGLSF